MTDLIHIEASRISVPVYDNDGQFICTATLINRDTAISCSYAIGERDTLYLAPLAQDEPTEKHILHSFGEALVGASATTLGLKKLTFSNRTLIGLKSRAKTTDDLRSLGVMALVSEHPIASSRVNLGTESKQDDDGSVFVQAYAQRSDGTIGKEAFKSRFVSGVIPSGAFAEDSPSVILVQGRYLQGMSGGPALDTSTRSIVGLVCGHPLQQGFSGGSSQRSTEKDYNSKFAIVPSAALEGILKELKSLTNEMHDEIRAWNINQKIGVLALAAGVIAAVLNASGFILSSSVASLGVSSIAQTTAVMMVAALLLFMVRANRPYSTLQYLRRCTKDKQIYVMAGLLLGQFLLIISSLYYIPPTEARIFAAVSSPVALLILLLLRRLRLKQFHILVLLVYFLAFFGALATLLARGSDTYTALVGTNLAATGSLVWFLLIVLEDKRSKEVEDRDVFLEYAITLLLGAAMSGFILFAASLAGVVDAPALTPGALELLLLNGARAAVVYVLFSISVKMLSWLTADLVAALGIPAVFVLELFLLDRAIEFSSLAIVVAAFVSVGIIRLGLPLMRKAKEQD